MLAATLPATAGFLDDARVDVSFPAMLRELVVGILLATVLPEELGFRGLLLGSGAEAWGRRRAVLASSLLFGLWHISPTLGTADENSRLAEASSSGGGEVAIVVGAVGAVALTFVAGLVLSWLRLRSRSLLAPCWPTSPPTRSPSSRRGSSSADVARPDPGQGRRPRCVTAITID